MKYLIIGAGPAGLSTAVEFKKLEIDFEIVDDGLKVGGIWDINRNNTPMYRSAHFISSKSLSGFKDYDMPSIYPDYPSHSLIQKYIQDYTDHHKLLPHITFETKVISAEPKGPYWHVTFSDKSYKVYKGIVCATGITWHQNHPKLEGDLDGDIIHSFDYKDSSLFKDRNVLIVGGGNSGCDIACDAARTAKNAYISMRRGYYFIPKYTFGIPSDLFKEKFKFPLSNIDTKLSEFLLNKILVGNLENYGLPKPDHKLMESHPIMNSRLLHYLGHGDIKYKGNLDRLAGDRVIFEDGTSELIDLVVTATGYKRVFPFLSDKLLDKDGNKEVDLYLEIFSKKFENLFFVGGIEVSSAVFALFGLQGETIATFINAKQKSKLSYKKFLEDKRNKDVNLKGSNQYIETQRHARYVDKKSYKTILNREIKRLGNEEAN